MYTEHTYKNHWVDTGGNVLMCGLMGTFGPKQQVKELKQVTFQNSDYRVKQNSSFKSVLVVWRKVARLHRVFSETRDVVLSCWTVKMAQKSEEADEIWAKAPW